MADPLSIIAGIVGVAVASAQLANKIHDFSDKYRNAPTQMHDIASEMSHLSSIFKTLATVLEEGSGAYKPRVLVDAQSILDRAKKIQDEIKKLMKKNNGIRARVKWAINAGKTGELLDRIEALKSSLSILLDTTQLAMACREPRSTNLEIERLKQLITAGVKEIRQCVIGLQTAKPEHMFDPSMTLTTGTSSDLPDSHANPRLPPVSPLPPPPPPAVSYSDGNPSTQRSRDAAPKQVLAIEPSSSQSETASWLYNMTLASSGDVPMEVSDNGRLPNKSPTDERFDSGDHASLTRKVQQVASPDQVHPNSTQLQLSKIPPPQKLYEISVSAIAQNLIRNWTYLDPTRHLLEEVSHDDGDSDASAEDSSSGSEDYDSSRSKSLRPRFPGGYSSPDGYHQPLRGEPQKQAFVEEDETSHEDEVEAVEIVPAPRPHSPMVDSLLEKLEQLLSGREEEEQKATEAARQAAEDAKFARLEGLLISEKEARLEKDKAKQEAREKHNETVAEMERNDVRDELRRLGELILVQKDDEQKRDARTRSIRAAQQSWRLEKHKMAEEHRTELRAAQKAREDVEKVVKELAEEQELCKKVTEGLVNEIYGKESMKRWYLTGSGPKLVDISDGYFAREILYGVHTVKRPSCESGSSMRLDIQHTVDEMQQEQRIMGSNSFTGLSIIPGKHHLVFSNTSAKSTEHNAMAAALKDEGIETLFEIDKDGGPGKLLHAGNTLLKASIESFQDPLTENIFARSASDVFINGSLLWQSLPRNGQSELYQSLCKIGWKPTYLRASEKGQTWFYGSRPVHVRFSRSDYVPRFTDFDNDTFQANVMIGTDVVDEDALRLAGIEYQLSQTGCWMLDASITYDDIAALTATSFMLRETSLRREARKAMSTSASTLNRIKGSHIVPAPLVPTLRAFRDNPEALFGSQENILADP